MLHWWTAEPEALSRGAIAALEKADAVAVAGVSWYKLAWLAVHERIALTRPVESWLADLGARVLTIGITPSIASAAARLPAAFPGDPVDRIIYATAVERGWPLITKDRRMRSHKHPRPVTLW